MVDERSPRIQVEEIPRVTQNGIDGDCYLPYCPYYFLRFGPTRYPRVQSSRERHPCPAPTAYFPFCVHSHVDEMAAIYQSAKHISRKKKDDKPLKIGILTSFLLWAFFIVIIILLFTIPNNVKNFTCVTPPSERDTLTDQSMIAIAYNCFYAFVCFCCAGLFLFLGISLYTKLDKSKSEGATAAQEKKAALSKVRTFMWLC